MRMVLLAIVTLVAACGDPQVVQLPPPVPQAQPSAQGAEPDAYADFRGPHAKAGSTFRLTGKPMAVDGPNVVVSIVKVEWSTLSGPSGKDTREASVNLRVQKAQEERVVTLGQGDARTVLGAKLTLLSAGEDYDKTRLSYEPWIDLRVDPPDATP